MAYFKKIFQYLLGGTEENNENIKSGESVSGTAYTQIRNKYCLNQAAQS
jgi:hypothetical protein